MNRLPYAFMGAGILLALGFVYFFSREAPPNNIAPNRSGIISLPSSTDAVVEYVIDGDTIVLQNGAHIRYIGMNAPEIAHPEYSDAKPAQCYGEEAAEENKRLVLGKTVHLTSDPEDKDKYGRFLRYVWIGDTMIDLKLVEEGYARILDIPPDDTHAAQFANAENQAKAAKLGLWGACAN